MLPVIEARYPALLFKQQLTAYVEKIYGIIRDNVKKELSSLLSLCIQAPKMAITNVLVRGTGLSFGNQNLTASRPWQSIIEILNNLLEILLENHIPDVLIQKMFTQVFSFINVQLFNSLLLRRECCTFSNGEYVKASMADLELWCARKKQYSGSSWEELKHIRQSVGFLVIFQKSRISYDEIASDLCPVLSVTQLYKICTQYWDDKYNSKSVSSTVLSSMANLMSEDRNSDDNAFLLDDNSSIPFSVDELTNSVNEKDFLDVKTAKELHGDPNFPFLQD